MYQMKLPPNSPTHPQALVQENGLAKDVFAHLTPSNMRGILAKTAIPPRQVTVAVPNTRKGLTGSGRTGLSKLTSNAVTSP